MYISDILLLTDPMRILTQYHMAEIQSIKQTTKETYLKMVVPGFPKAKTRGPTFPEGAMTFFGTFQTIENIGNH